MTECGAKGPAGFYCTLTHGHELPHVAEGVQSHVYEVWGVPEHKGPILVGDMNRQLALWLREIHKRREASWNPEHHKVTRHPYTEGAPPVETWGGQYTRTHSEIIHEVVGDSPIAKLLECLLTAGYHEMWEFCDEVLGSEVKP